MGESAIEWTEQTWNPTTGCDRISPGCDHCYALDLAASLKRRGQRKYQRDGDPPSTKSCAGPRSCARGPADTAGRLEGERTADGVDHLGPEPMNGLEEVAAARKRQRGREPWSERNIRRPYDDPEPMRLAFADPPYPEQAERHYGDHPDYAGEVDHGELIDRLMAYDGWVLCTGAVMLPDIVKLCPKGTRVLVWRKDVMWKPGVSVSFSWEPVLIYGGRRRHRHATILADSIATPPVFEKFNGTSIGIKPYPYCAWVFEALGARPDDTLKDLFPGSGAVGRAWTRWIGAPSLPIFAPADGTDQLEVA